ncbi:MAG: superoxide dismutase [Ni] [Planctomycetota bacterium]
MNAHAARIALCSLAVAALATVWLATPQQAYAHCQVPCGIYGDELKFEELAQHIQTIEKSMTKIAELVEEDGASTAQDVQQLVRWVENKETHATKIQVEAQEYFLAQRVPLPKNESEHEAYFAKLQSLHEIIVYAMKCKQTVDPANVQKLRSALATFKTQYFDQTAHHEHHPKQEDAGQG